MTESQQQQGAEVPDRGWQSIEIAGKRADVFVPSAPPPYRGAVLSLHGHSGRTIRDNAVFTAELEKHRWPAICPHGARSWWLDRICSEFDETVTPEAFLRESVLPEFERRWEIVPPRIAVIGNSMGGQGALRLSYRFPRLYPIAAGMSPAVDFHNWHGQGLPLDEMFSSPEAARQETATLHVHPLNWPKHQMFVCDPQDAEWFEGCERLASKLISMGIPFERDLETQAGGHTWEYLEFMAPRVFEFVAERLRT